MVSERLHHDTDTSTWAKQESQLRAIAAIPEREREIALLNAALKCYSDEQAKDKAEVKRLRARVAELEALIKPIAAIPLWRDTYPDGPEIGLGKGDAATAIFTVEQVRKARSLLATATTTEGK